ncbi:MAG: RES family NAD+ phosphorylase [Terracidiphilus sp.]
MKSLWRVSNHCDLDGLGGEKSDGRWHTAARGKRIVYLSESPAGALLESLANLKGNPALFPEKYQLLEVGVPDDVYASMVYPTGASPASRAFYKTLAQSLSRKKGDNWLRSNVSALAGVPSFPSPYSLNILLNPKHRDGRRITVEACRRIKYDRRQFHVHPAGK